MVQGKIQPDKTLAVRIIDEAIEKGDTENE